VATPSRNEGRTRRKTTTRKISLNLTGEAEEIVVRLAEKRDSTFSDVVRRALALAAFFDEETSRGGTFLITYDNGKTFERVHLLSP
jgi:hypothetical protein